MKSARAHDPLQAARWLFDAGVLLALPLVFYRGFAEQFSYPKTFLAKLLVIFGATLWAVGAVWGKLRWPKHFRLIAPLALLTFAVLLSCVNSPVPRFSLEEAEYFLCGPLWMVLLASWGGGAARVRGLAKLATLGACIVAAVAVMQWAGWDPLLFGGFEVEWGTMVGRMRAYSTLGNPNFVGGYLIGAIFPAIALARAEPARWSRVGWWAAAGLMLLATVGAGSRGAWLGLIAGLLVFVFVGRLSGKRSADLRSENRKNPNPFAIRLTVIPAAVWLGLVSLGNLLSTLPGRLEGRLYLWRASWPMFGAHPWLGSGWGTFQLQFLDLQARFLAERPDQVIHWSNIRQLHNDPLQLLLETGLLGFAAFAWLLWMYARELRRGLRSADAPSERLWLEAGAGGATAIFLDSVFNFQFAVPPTFFLFFTFLAVPTVVIAGGAPGHNEVEIQPAQNAQRKQGRRMVLRVLASLCIFLLGAMLLLPILRHAKAETDFAAARLSERAGNLTGAEEFYRRGVSLDPLNGRLHFGLARVLYLEGRFPEALAETLAAEGTFRDSHLEVLKARIFDHMGHPAIALETYRHALGLDPTLKAVQKDIERLSQTAPP